MKTLTLRITYPDLTFSKLYGQATSLDKDEYGPIKACFAIELAGVLTGDVDPKMTLLEVWELRDIFQIAKSIDESISDAYEIDEVDFNDKDQLVVSLIRPSE